jgi:hypothetical protein
LSRYLFFLLVFHTYIMHLNWMKNMLKNESPRWEHTQTQTDARSKNDNFRIHSLTSTDACDHFRRPKCVGPRWRCLIHMKLVKKTYLQNEQVLWRCILSVIFNWFLSFSNHKNMYYPSRSSFT